MNFRQKYFLQNQPKKLGQILVLACFFLLNTALWSQKTGALLLWTSERDSTWGEALSPHWPLYRLVFSDSLAAASALSKLAQDPRVRLAQHEHYLQWRKPQNLEPNDPEYPFWQAKHLERMGLPQVWEKTQGGQTALGEALVIAILDGGGDWQHEDLQANHHRNRGEIPNNGLDDDQNGYIDDYLGWNVDTETDALDTNNAHATSVAGIIGARGNNQIGITGINWEANLLFIGLSEQLALAEARVLRAYAYIWQLRRLYNETGGQRGALVTLSNGSFGLDRAWASNHPIWCAILDSLGQVGILTVAATANLPDDIDRFGDMPATCPSDFLVVVTQTDPNTDALHPFSAYGLKHVDLAAPGAVYSTRPRNTYQVFGGTSGAAPHVAGGLAILQSWPNELWARYQREQPAKAALLLKHLLIQTVDLQPSLRGRSQSGGRLNLARAAQALEAYFQSQPVLIDCEWAGLLPAQSDLRAWISTAQGRFDWEISDVLGRIWRSGQVVEPTGAGRKWWSVFVGDLPAGVYHLRIQAGGQSLTRVWIKGQ